MTCPSLQGLSHVPCYANTSQDSTLQKRDRNSNLGFIQYDVGFYFAVSLMLGQVNKWNFQSCHKSKKKKKEEKSHHDVGQSGL